MDGADFYSPGMEAACSCSLTYPQCLAQCLIVERIDCSEAEKEEQLWVGKIMVLLRSEGSMGHPSRQRYIYVCIYMERETERFEVWIHQR